MLETADMTTKPRARNSVFIGCTPLFSLRPMNANTIAESMLELYCCSLIRASSVWMKSAAPQLNYLLDEVSRKRITRTHLRMSNRVAFSGDRIHWDLAFRQISRCNVSLVDATSARVRYATLTSPFRVTMLALRRLPWRSRTYFSSGCGPTTSTG